MPQPSTRVPVEHSSIIYDIETDIDTDIDTVSDETPSELTLLELIDAVSEVSNTEQEVIATISYMLNSGRVRLAENFRDAPVERLCG